MPPSTTLLLPTPGTEFSTATTTTASQTANTLPRTARNSKPLEVIGTYDPIPKKDTYDTSGKLHKDIKLDLTRAKYWIGVGAQPTDTVRRLLSYVRLVLSRFCILEDVSANHTITHGTGRYHEAQVQELDAGADRAEDRRLSEQCTERDRIFSIRTTR